MAILPFVPNYNVRTSDNIFIEGDIAKGQLLLPYAFQLMRMARLTNIPVMHKMVEDSTIRVEFMNGHGRIYITAQSGGLYLETGFIDIHGVIFCSEEVFLPGTLYHPNILINGKAEYVDNSLSSESYANGSESRTLTCNKPTQSVRDSCGTTYSYSGSGRGYCSMNDLLTRKQDRNKVQPSLFPGKLKLFVQCLYGSKRDDYSAVFGAAAPTLRLSGITLSPIPGSDNWCLYTTDNYEYYLVNISGSSFRYVRLTMSPEADIWLSKIDEVTSDHRLALESYVLATAEIKDTIITKPYLGAELEGISLYYGWQANWDGSNMDIVLHKGVVVGNENDAGFGGQDDGYAWQAQHFSASIGGSGNNLTCSISKVEVGTPWNTTNSGILPWVPFGASHHIFVFNGGLFTRYVGEHTGAALLCWYDVDTLKFVTSDYKPKSSTTTSDSYGTLPVDERYFFGQGERITDETYYNRSTEKGKSTIRAGSASLEYEDYVSGSEKTWYGEYFTDDHYGIFNSGGTYGHPEFDSFKNREEGTRKAKAWAIGTGYCEENSTHTGDAVGIEFDPEAWPITSRRYHIGWGTVESMSARYEGRSNTIKNGAVVLILSDKSCTDMFIGHRQRDTAGNEKKTNKQIGNFSDPVLFWMVRNPQTNQIMATSKGVAWIHPATDNMGYVKFNTGPIISSKAVNEAPEKIYAVTQNDFILTSDHEGNPDISGGWFYVDWLAGGLTMGGSPTIKSSLFGEYDITFSSGTININNGFNGDYTVGYK